MSRRFEITPKSGFPGTGGSVDPSRLNDAYRGHFVNHEHTAGCTPLSSFGVGQHNTCVAPSSPRMQLFEKGCPQTGEVSMGPTGTRHCSDTTPVLAELKRCSQAAGAEALNHTNTLFSRIACDCGLPAAEERSFGKGLPSTVRRPRLQGRKKELCNRSRYLRVCSRVTARCLSVL